MTESGKKRRKLVPEMEGAVARRYAQLRGTERQLAQYRQQAGALTTNLPDGAAILEVAPGPGYLAIELARSGRTRVTGLDISRYAKQVQIWLGHHSPAFTLATYVHLLPDDLPDPDFLDGLTAAGMATEMATRPTENGRETEPAETSETLEFPGRTRTAEVAAVSF